MKTLINIAMKFTGAGFVWTKLNGIKTYLIGTVSILSGVAGMLQQVVGLIDAKDWGAVYAWLQAMPNDPAFLLLMGGLGAISLRHGMQKTAPQEPPKAP